MKKHGSSAFLDVSDTPLDTSLSAGDVGRAAGVAPRQLTSGVDQFFGTVAIERLYLPTGAGELRKSSNRILARSLGTRFAVAPVRTKV